MELDGYRWEVPPENGLIAPTPRNEPGFACVVSPVPVILHVILFGFAGVLFGTIAHALHLGLVGLHFGAEAWTIVDRGVQGIHGTLQ